MKNILKDNLVKFGGVPSEALKFAFDSEVIGTPTEEKGVKVKMIARSKLPVKNHPFFGNVVHDFSTMTLPSKIAIDYNHETEIGYTKSFAIDNSGLIMDGVIFKNSENLQHPANNVIYNLKNNIPQQCSIDFSQGTYDVEVPQGSCMVNGILFNDGDIDCIIKNFKVCAVAVCKLGADENTLTQAMFSNENKKFTNPENMSKLIENSNVEEVTEDVADIVVVKEEDSPIVAEPTTDKVEEVPVVEEQSKIDNNVSDEVPVQTPEVPVEVPVVEETPKVEDTTIIDELVCKVKKLTSMVDELTAKNKQLVENESLSLKKVEELQFKHKNIIDSLGQEPIKNNEACVEQFKTWRECVESVRAKFSLNDLNAHVKAIEMFPEFHKTQIKKI